MDTRKTGRGLRAYYITPPTPHGRINNNNNNVFFFCYIEQTSVAAAVTAADFYVPRRAVKAEPRTKGLRGGSLKRRRNVFFSLRGRRWRRKFKTKKKNRDNILRHIIEIAYV